MQESKRSPGAKKLLDYRTEKKLSQRVVAEALGVTAPCVNDWEAGKVQPSDLNKRKIEKWSLVPDPVTGLPVPFIPTSAWDAPEDAEKLRGVTPHEYGRREAS